MADHIVEVDVVSDIMCPWCYIGKRRLEKALTLIEPGIEVEINWRPYQLDPTIPAEGRDRQKYLSQKFGAPEQIAAVYDPVREAGEVEEIPFDFEKITLSPNTLDAHRLIRWAMESGLQDEMSERLFKAYFIDGQDLTDNEVLLDLAVEVGLERDVIERLLAGDTDRKTVQEEIAQYQQMGVRSVPTIIVGKKYAVVGAQQPETIAEVIGGVFEERKTAAGS